LALDADENLYVADIVNHVIRKLMPDGIVTTWVGSPNDGFVDGFRDLARFYLP
jgi:hypothetical protein